MNVSWLRRDLIVGPYFTLCTTPEQLDREIRRLSCPERPAFIKNEWSNATTHFLENGEKRLCAIVCMPVRPNATGIQVAALLVHEAVHIFQAFCQRIGEHSPSDEFQAYAIQLIAQELMLEYARQTKRS